ncbi:MAG: CoA pyrophosphatase [Myxococcales bacterium]|nr:CoA pyrophosphatase [Myxococcales bacterium]
MTASTDLEAIRARLGGRPHTTYDGEIRRRAAVAAVLRPVPGDTEILLIRRAEREGDPWSGHMALPGGHHDPGDMDMFSTARRETHEEVGLALSPGTLVGALDEHPATARGQFTGIVIAPFVFAVEGAARLAPNDEVAEALWAPLGRMARGELDVVKEVERGGERVRFPGYGVGEHVVWGLTHRVLQNLFQSLG